MSDNVTNSVAFQLNFILQNLKDWAKNEGGLAVIVKDYADMFETAFKCTGPRLLICFEGEDLRGPQEWAAVASRVDRHYAVLVSRGEGMTAHRGETLTEDSKSGRPFYTLVEEARDLIRVIYFDPDVTEATPQTPIDYHGIEPVMLNGYFLDAYLIRFSIGTQLGQPKSNFTWIQEGPPNPPANLQAFDQITSVLLTWTINSPNTSGTTIQRSLDNMSWADYDTVGQSVERYTDSVVNMATAYFYRVYSTSPLGVSAKSNTVSIFV